MSQTNLTFLYFGCVDRPGHHLRNENLHPTYDKKYRNLERFDGLLPPQDGASPYIAAFARLGGFELSAIAFWDYSVDNRGGCNSVFFVNSMTIRPDEMLVEVKKRFPTIFARFPQDVVFHESVSVVMRALMFDEAKLPEIAKDEYEEFVNIYYNENRYRGYLFGKAFYHHFHLYTIPNQALLQNLNEKATDEAVVLIEQLFRLTKPQSYTPR